ncbi:hypothetical protein NEHOM01_1717 [Nematocida homosporus]|uniref:uncharacterized protein n=1 Tax=Nematocida homosporus TaxID=1912981 RepID=UPI0022202BA4|nr:uncharacterized protein NEHOM01_1717 [Nematocida homosporus]KAI5186816.1 hypothetical protein NEHOM01_1717 [Nematocida homosporus]
MTLRRLDLFTYMEYSFGSEKGRMGDDWGYLIGRYDVKLGDMPKKEKIPEKEFSKASILGVRMSTMPKEVYRVGEYCDLVEVYVEDLSVLDRVVQWTIASIRFDLGSKVLYLKRGLISRANSAHIYLNIDLAGYFNVSTRRNWIANVKDLLRLSSKSGIIVSTGQAISREEVVALFKQFGLKEKTILRFVSENPQEMLVRAAIRKHAHLGVVSLVQPNESDFKQMIYKANKLYRNIR